MAKYEFVDGSGQRWTATGESYGGPIALVTFERVDGHAQSLIRSRLDLDKVMFIDQLPGTLASFVGDITESLFERSQLEGERHLQASWP